jgi:hypothetical protein
MCWRAAEPEAIDSGLLTPGATEIETQRTSLFVRGGTDQHQVRRRMAVERSRDRRPPDVARLHPLPARSVC